jgi:prevent-host-death family protein
MTTISATEARKQLYTLLDDVSQTHEPVQITGKRGHAVLVSEDDWRAVQETLYLASIPGVSQDILEGMATPADQLEDEPAGELGAALHEAGVQGCARARRGRAEAKGTGAARHPRGRPVHVAAAVREAGRRPLRMWTHYE